MTAHNDRMERFAGTAVLFIILVSMYCLPPELLNLEVCPFKLMYNVPCPLCGISRSMYHTARGNIALAYSFHPAGIFLFFTLLSAFPVLLFSPLYNLIRKYNTRTGFLRYYAIGISIMIILFGIVRIISVQ